MADRVASSVEQFIALIREEKDRVLKSLMKFKLDLAMKIAAQTQDNIRDNFGAGKGGGRSPITERSDGGSARGSGRGGGLFGSVQVSMSGSDPVVSVGGPGVPYAAIQEFGGTIRPSSARFLTIPFAPEYRGHRAREFDLVFAVDDEWGYVLRPRGLDDIAYLLRTKATLPPRPYFQPAVNKVIGDETVSIMLKKLMGQSSLEVKVG